MPKPAVYLRVSSDIQKEKHSIRSQEDALTSWFELQGLAHDDLLWYRDDGVSGKWVSIMERGDGAKLVADVKAGLVSNFCAVFSISRIARDAADYHQFRSVLRNHNLHLLGYAEAVDTSKKGGDFVAGIHALVAEESHRGMMEAIRSGKKRTAKEGKWQGRAPYGYMVEAGRLLIDESKAEIVRTIYRLYLDGRGTVSICNHLTDLAIPAPVQGKWRPSTIKVILTNPVYKGTALWNRVQVARDQRKHPRPASEHIAIAAPVIIPPGEWERVQQIFSLHSKRFGRTGAAATGAYLTRVRCLLCGARYYRQKRSDSTTFYYRHSRDGEPCKSENVQAILLDGEVWQAVLDAVANPRQWLVEMVARREQAIPPSQAEQRRDDLTAALQRVTQQIDRLEEMALTGAMSIERYTIKATDLNSQKDTITRQLEALTESTQRIMARAETELNLAAIMQTYGPRVDRATFEERAKMIDTLIALVRVSRKGKHVEIELEWAL